MPEEFLTDTSTGMPQTVETTSATEGAQQAPQEPIVADRPRRPSRREMRKARVVIRKVGPWSVFKFSLLFYFCVMLVMFWALVILYLIMGATGVLDHLSKLLTEVGFGPKEGTFEFNGRWIFTRVFVGLAGMVVIWSLINVFVAVLYNLVSDVVGGVEVTLGEKH